VRTRENLQWLISNAGQRTCTVKTLTAGSQEMANKITDVNFQVTKEQNFTSNEQMPPDIN